MKKKLLGFITHPLFISLILTSILLYITHPLFPIYKAELIKKEKVHSNHFVFFSDLNNDGFSEEIALDKSYKDRISIIVKDKGSILDQWIIDGIFNMPEPFFGDFNNDGLKEIFLLTIANNEILLNCFNPYERKFYITNRLIDKFYPKNNEKNTSFVFCELNDLDEDGNEEIIFGLAAGYSIFPRNFYSYNITENNLTKSENGCISFYDVERLYDKKNDSTYYFSSNYAVGNCDSNLLYSDYHTWLTIFNENLNFKFEPIKIGMHPSDLNISPVLIDEKIFIAALNLYQGSANYKSTIALYNFDGIKIKEKDIFFSEEWMGARILKNDEEPTKLYLIKTRGNIDEISSNLDFSPINKILPFDDTITNNIDCDQDGLVEFIVFHRKLEKVTILRNNFKDQLVIDVIGNTEILYKGIVLNDNEDPLLNLRLDNYSYFYKYYKNPFYNIRFLFYVLIYFGIFGLLYVLQKAQNYRLQQKFNTQKEISELQMKSIKNQMDPHFTLNIINSIGSLFSKQETEKANYIFGKYSKLLRQTILSSDQILTTLNDELEYVENYMTLEQFRIKGGFDFNIDIEDGYK